MVSAYSSLTCYRKIPEILALAEIAKVRNMISRVQDYHDRWPVPKRFSSGPGYNDLLRRKPETVAKDMEKLLDMMPDDQNVLAAGSGTGWLR